MSSDQPFRTQEAAAIGRTAPSGYDYGQAPPSRLVPDAGGRGWLVAHGLAKSYRGRQVVHEASLAVARGEAVGLLGSNGAGKTTIFYMITGLVKADEGTIELDGHDVTGMPMYRRARLGIGYLPQEASIFRGLTVEANIRAVLEVVEPDKAQREDQLDALLDEFHITHLRTAQAMSLSGGERRRCEIARALASRPAFMLLDEPFTGVDPIAVGDIQALVRHLTSLGIGVLITDHNVRETLGLIDRAYIIHSRRGAVRGPAGRDRRESRTCAAFTLANNSAFNRDARIGYDWARQAILGPLSAPVDPRVMALSQKLEFRQSQSLVMTPQLMQAIKLLQLSNLDLVAYVEAELERNPLLDRANDEDGGERATTARRRRCRVAVRRRCRRRRLDGDRPRRQLGRPWRRSSIPISPMSFPTTTARPRPKRPPALPAETWAVAPSRQPVSSDDYNLEAFVAGETTLADHLANQLGLAVTDPALRLIGGTIINEIDEAGYFRGDLDDHRRAARRQPRPCPRGAANCPELRSVRHRRARPRANAWRSSCASATATIRRWRRWSTTSNWWRGATRPR